VGEKYDVSVPRSDGFNLALEQLSHRQQITKTSSRMIFTTPPLETVLMSAGVLPSKYTTTSVTRGGGAATAPTSPAWKPGGVKATPSVERYPSKRERLEREGVSRFVSTLMALLPTSRSCAVTSTVMLRQVVTRQHGFHVARTIRVWHTQLLNHRHRRGLLGRRYFAAVIRQQLLGVKVGLAIRCLGVWYGHTKEAIAAREYAELDDLQAVEYALRTKHLTEIATKELEAKTMIEKAYTEQLASLKAQLAAEREARVSLEAEVSRKSELIEKIHQNVRLYTHSIEAGNADPEAEGMPLSPLRESGLEPRSLVEVFFTLSYPR